MVEASTFCQCVVLLFPGNVGDPTSQPSAVTQGIVTSSRQGTVSQSAVYDIGARYFRADLHSPSPLFP